MDLPSFPAAFGRPQGLASWPGKQQGGEAKPCALQPTQQPTQPPAQTPSPEGRVHESRATHVSWSSVPRARPLDVCVMGIHSPIVHLVSLSQLTEAYGEAGDLGRAWRSTMPQTGQPRQPLLRLPSAPHQPPAQRHFFLAQSPPAGVGTAT